MRIGRLAEKAGISRSRIRFYETRGIIAPPPRTASGYRDYDPAMAQLLHFIVQAQEFGFSLEEIKVAVALKAQHRLNHDHVLAGLSRKLADTERHIAAARKRRAKIKEMIAAVTGDLTSRLR